MTSRLNGRPHLFSLPTHDSLPEYIKNDMSLEDPSAIPDEALLTAEKHIRYCLLHLQILPTPYESEDCSRWVGLCIAEVFRLLGSASLLKDRCIARNQHVPRILSLVLARPTERYGPYLS